MKVSPKQLSSAIAKLYDAALQPELWQEFLREIAGLTHGDSAALMIHDTKDRLHDVYQQANVPENALAEYQQYYGNCDVWSARGENVVDTTWLGTSEMLCPFNELAPTEYFNDFLVKHGISHALFAFIERTPHRVMNLSIYRDANGGEFPGWGVETMALLQPHLKRALELHSRLARVEHKAHSFAFAVDKSPQKIIFLSSTGKVLFLNKAALAVVSRNDGLRIQHDRLRSEEQRENAAIEKLVREAAATANGRGFGAGGSVSISRKSSPPLLLLVVPIPFLSIGVAENAAVAVFVVDPLEHPHSQNDLLKAAFGLTPAETRVASMIANGLTIEEIANELKVTRNTLKSQLSSIYSKIGIKRQSQLTRIVLQFPGSD